MLIIEIWTEGRFGDLFVNPFRGNFKVISMAADQNLIVVHPSTISQSTSSNEVPHKKMPDQLRLSLQDMRPFQKRQTPKNSFTSKVSRYERLFYDNCRIVTSQGYRWDGDQKEKGSFNEWAFRDGLAQEDRTTWNTHGCGLAWIDIIYGYGYHRPYWEF